MMQLLRAPVLLPQTHGRIMYTMGSGDVTDPPGTIPSTVVSTQCNKYINIQVQQLAADLTEYLQVGWETPPLYSHQFRQEYATAPHPPDEIYHGVT